MTRAAPTETRNRREPSRRRRGPITVCDCSWRRRSIVGPVRDGVTDAALGLNGVALEWLVDLAAQIAHVDLDDVGVTLEVRTPHSVEDLWVRQDGPGPSHETLAGEILAQCGFDRDVSPGTH